MVDFCEDFTDSRMAVIILRQEIARAGIDIALHDLTGKLLAKSLCQMWGLPRGGPITLSWTVNARTLDEVDRVMETGRKRMGVAGGA